MSVFSLTVCLGPTAWRLLYKTEEKAKEHFNFVGAPIDKTLSFSSDETIKIEDDFGQSLIIKRSSLHGCMFENMDQAKLGMVELNVQQMRVQNGVQQRIEADPTLRSGRMGQSPAIISPMGNGRFPS